MLPLPAIFALCISIHRTLFRINTGSGLILAAVGPLPNQRHFITTNEKHGTVAF